MPPSPCAIQISDAVFFYETPKKTRLFKSLPFGYRVTTEKFLALDQINLSVKAGRITALLGRNGSGKTTLIKLISGIRFPHKGEVRIFGLPPTKQKQRIGLCLGNSLIYYRLTARENLQYFGNLYGVSDLKNRIDELAALLDLERHLDQVVESFSFGMKAKLALARSLIHSPDLLILDEPTLGIDLNLALQLRQFIRGLKCTVLLTTHYMDEADVLADDLCIIEKGKIVSYGTRQEILTQYHAKDVGDVFCALTNQPGDLRKAS